MDMDMDKNNEVMEMLDFVAPGTEIRKGLNNILDARTGAMIVIGDDDEVLKMVDGGFFINCDYNPQRIYELAKMDGAIILNKTTSKILYANIQLQPDPTIETKESGTRHRTAERVSKQTGNLVIAISEKRNRITLYKEESRYQLRNITDIMSEANQALKTLERYKSVLDKSLTNLTIMEFDDLVTLYETTISIQRFEMVFRIAEEVKRYIVELGAEGRLINMQLEELLIGTKEEMIDLIKDYYNSKEEIELDTVLNQLDRLSQDELLEVENISYVLGYGRNYNALDNKIIPKGHRVLGKILKLTKRDIEKLVDRFQELNNILEATIDELSEVKGISKFKARSIKNGLTRLKTTTLLEK